MNFFAAQDQARKVSRRLVAAYIVATILIVAGVTAIVSFALFSFTRAGYGTYTAAGFFTQNWAIPVGVALLTTAYNLGSSM